MTLSELMMTTLVATTLLAIAVPSGMAALDSLALGNARQAVGTALQTARLRAVSANRPMRLRLNCPATGQYRVVEVTGVSSVDNSGARCDEAVFGYPGPKDSDPATPAHDMPVQRLSSKIDSLSGPDLEFAPDGTTRVFMGGGFTTMVEPAFVQVTREGLSMGISINALGRIQTQ